MSWPIFRDRRDAGRQLAEKLRGYATRRDGIVLGLARGGVPVAYEIARALDFPLEAFTVRKLGVPGQPELAMGAIASGGDYYLNHDLISHLGISRHSIEEVVQSEKEELDRRERLFGEAQEPIALENRTVIVVDDGLATGASMFAAVRAIRAKKPRVIVVAVPVASASSRAEIAPFADDFVCLHAPRYFRAVGEWYEDFSQTSDDEVRHFLTEQVRSGGDGPRETRFPRRPSPKGSSPAADSRSRA